MRRVGLLLVALGAKAFLVSEDALAKESMSLFGAEEQSEAQEESAGEPAPRILTAARSTNYLVLEEEKDWFAARPKQHELQRMGDLMRRQLQPFAFSYDYCPGCPTSCPTSAPTPIPTPVPTPLPSMLPTSQPTDPTSSPTTAAPSVSPAPTIEVTPTPTLNEVAQVIVISTSIIVDGLTEDDLPSEDLVSQVLANALNDVVPEFEGPESVLASTIVFLDDSTNATRRRLEDTSSTLAEIFILAVVDTCSEFMHTTNDGCAQTIDDTLEIAAANGTLQERILYWAAYFGVDLVLVVTPDTGNTTWFFQTATPTSVPTAPTFFPTMTPAPSTTPTSTPTSMPTTPMPTAAFPTSSAPSPLPIPAPTSASPTVTSAPSILPDDNGGSKKKSSNNNQAVIIIVVVVVIVAVLLCCCLAYLYHRQQERKLTDRKDSWDISTMFTDEANLPSQAEELVQVEDEHKDDVGPDVSLAPGVEEGVLVPLEDDQPQELQKITQAAEL